MWKFRARVRDAEAMLSPTRAVDELDELFFGSASIRA
jgi:hypothetical protein